MKTLLLTITTSLLLLTTSTTVAQSNDTFNLECSDLFNVKTDKMTGKIRTYVNESLIISENGHSGFSIFIYKKKPIISMCFTVRHYKCVDDDSKINVLFRDGTRLNLENDTSFNCDSDFTLYFGGIFGHYRALELFRTKEVETMRVGTYKGYMEEDFTPYQSKKLMKIMDCLSKLNN